MAAWINTSSQKPQKENEEKDEKNPSSEVEEDNSVIVIKLWMKYIWYD